MNLVPLADYTHFYYHFLLVVTLVVFMQSFKTELSSDNNLKFKSLLGYFLVFVIVFYMGLRPISFVFGDMGTYFKEFNEYVHGKSFDNKKEYIFESIKYFFAQSNNPEIFFFVCVLLYILPLYFVSKTLFNNYWFYGFFLLVASFSFWSYGTNGIRNGIGTSLFLFAITRKKVLVKIPILISTFFFHKSMAIPVLAYALASSYKKTKLYFYVWLLAIPLSIVLGSFWEAFFLGFGFGEKKLDGYLGDFDQISEGVVIQVGFRWDFLIYSASGVFAAWYFIFKQKFQDVFYNNLISVYLTVNAFWILIIRANYSNRFAYLSWFMLALVIIYPLLKVKLFSKQHQVIGKIIFGYFLFTYVMNVILNKG